MRAFACSSLGNNCSWKHAARTEELLADVAALHLRDVHGVAAVDPVLIGRIKNSFSDPAPLEEKAAEDLRLKAYRCSMGSGCDFRYIAQTEELIVDGVAVHAREAHGISEFTQEMKVAVEHSLEDWNG